MALLVREHKKAIRNGDAGANAQYLLDAMRKDEAEAYPTPESAAGEDPDVELRDAIQDLPEGMVDQQLLAEMTEVEVVTVAFTGFWLGNVAAHVEEDGNIPTPEFNVVNFVGKMMQEAVQRDRKSWTASCC